MMKKPQAIRSAFTMIELIFIIVILGILAGGAVMSIPDNRLFSDINFVTSAIKQKQMDAMLYDHHDFADTTWRDHFYDNTCIDTANIKSDEKASKKARKYQLKSTLTAAKICFDALGRPYHDNYTLNNLLQTPILLDIEYKQTKRKIKIMPYSGSIMIEK